MHPSRLGLCLVTCLFLSDSVGANESAVDLTVLAPERCEFVLAEIQGIEDATPSMVLSLLEEAILRYCAGVGGIEMPEGYAVEDRSEGSRSGGDLGDSASNAEVLIAEAAYYVEIAQQIDAGAANDLLRRLLGPDPVPKN